MENPMSNLTIRTAMFEDSQSIWEWRNDTQTRAMFRSSEYVDWETHSKWFEATIRRSDRALMVGVESETKESVGVVRFDIDEYDKAEVSINLNPQMRGKGFAKPLLFLSMKAMAGRGIICFTAEIKYDNKASFRTFKGLGFTELGASDGYLHLGKGV